MTPGNDSNETPEAPSLRPALEPSSAEQNTAKPTSRKGQSIPLGQRNIRLNPFYGQLVSTLKLLLPTVALSLVLLAIIWPLVVENEGEFVEKMTGADRQAAENLAVKNPQYSGIEDAGQPYTISAESMEQDSLDSEFVDLTQPKADILLSSGNWIAITAETGLLNRPSQVLELTNDVNLFHDLGYEFRTNQAVLDLLAGSASGDLPVFGQGPFGYLEGEGFRVLDRGARIALTGKSKVVIYPDRGQGSEDES